VEGGEDSEATGVAVAEAILEEVGKVADVKLGERLQVERRNRGNTRRTP